MPRGQLLIDYSVYYSHFFHLIHCWVVLLGFIVKLFRKVPHNLSNYLIFSGPKPETVQDLWRMIFEHKCPTVVMLTTLKEMGKVQNKMTRISIGIRLQ